MMSVTEDTAQFQMGRELKQLISEPDELMGNTKVQYKIRLSLNCESCKTALPEFKNRTVVLQLLFTLNVAAQYQHSHQHSEFCCCC